MSTSPDLLFDSPAPHVARITLHRPEARNALRSKLLAELASALAIAEGDPDVRCVILTGGPKAFAAGADVRELNDTPLEQLNAVRRPAWQAVHDFSKPLLAAVNGFCLGGGNELALLCDIVVAGDDAKFGQPEIKLGLIPGAGGTQRLTAALGKARAMKFVLTGELITAQEAFVAGLVSELVPAADVASRTLEIAQTIAAKSPLALRHAKAAVRHAAEAALLGGLALERQAFAEVFASADRREGIAAFLEKRAPNFTGR
jgi:enoyl-CoA hydratase